MNYPVNDPRHPWSRLATAARQVQDDRETPSAPYGFATRIAAMAMAQQPRMVSLLDRLALRALSVSCLLAVGSVALNYGAFSRAISGASATDDALMPTDVVSVVLDIAD